MKQFKKGGKRGIGRPFHQRAPLATALTAYASKRHCFEAFVHKIKASEALTKVLCPSKWPEINFLFYNFHQALFS